MSIRFKKSGILTTIQDLGRNGFRRFGVNPNGAMDKSAMRLVNILLGNDDSEAVLEFHFPAPEIVFEKAVQIALGGADFGANLNDKKIENWKIHFAEVGSVLRFDKKNFGNRAYLAIEGGFKIDKVLDSKSTNLTAKFSGFEGRMLKINDKIEFQIKKHIANRKLQIANSLIPFYSRFPTIRIISGAEFEDLTAISEQNFLKSDFVISPNSDRMGFRLQGNPIYLLKRSEIISSAVNFGTIQLLPNGQLIILMADHQTSGGYPRIANVIPTDLPLLAQLGTNDKIAFHLVSLSEAEELAFQFEKDLNFLKTAVKLLK